MKKVLYIVFIKKKFPTFYNKLIYNLHNVFEQKRYLQTLAKIRKVNKIKLKIKCLLLAFLLDVFFPHQGGTGSLLRTVPACVQCSCRHLNGRNARRGLICLNFSDLLTNVQCAWCVLLCLYSRHLFYSICISLCLI